MTRAVATHTGIGFSQEIDDEKAAKDAAFNAKTNLGQDKIDLALVLSTVHYDPKKILPVINRVLNNTKVIGCSTAGIILSDTIEKRGIAILTLRSDEMRFGTGSVENIENQDAHTAGTIIAKNCLVEFGTGGRQAFLFFVDGHIANNTPFLKGIQEVYGNVFPIVGAGSCDDFHFTHSFQFYQNKVLKNSAVGIIMGGHMHVGVGGRHGWKPLGKPRIIDSVDGNVIKTIDGKRAASLYEEYLGQEVAALHEIPLGQMAILYPLGIFIEGSEEYLLKNAIDILPDGSIVCQGEVPEQSEVHIMIGNKDSCKLAAIEAAREAKKNLLGKKPKLIIILESMARLKLLGRAAFTEVQRIKDVFEPGVPIIGMYAYGEICPFQTIERFKKPHLQNESITILAIN